jgi:monofunctional biosynthetic peptidoglycan transglycosylase
MEKMLSKGRILELYVNCIEWGRGIFGIDAAARAYFNKPASALTLEEGARLAAVIPSPLRHRPDADSRYVLRRMRIVLNRLAARNAALQPQTGGTSSPTEQEPIPATEGIDTTETQRGDGDDR